MTCRTLLKTVNFTKAIVFILFLNVEINGRPQTDDFFDSLFNFSEGSGRLAQDSSISPEHHTDISTKTHIRKNCTCIAYYLCQNMLFINEMKNLEHGNSLTTPLNEELSMYAYQSICIEPLHVCC